MQMPLSETLLFTVIKEMKALSIPRSGKFTWPYPMRGPGGTSCAHANEKNPGVWQIVLVGTIKKWGHTW